MIKIFPDTLEGAAPQTVMGFFRPIKAHPEDIDGRIEGHRSVCGCGRAEKSLLCIACEVAEGLRSIAPHQGLPSLEDDNPAAGAMQRIECCRGSLPADVGPRGILPSMVGAGCASQVAAVGELEAGQQRQIAPKDFSLEEKTGKTQEPCQRCTGLSDVTVAHETLFLRQRPGPGSPLRS